MLEIGVAGWVILLGLMVLSSTAGVLVSNALPWRAGVGHMPLAFGLALAPFILGLASVGVLTFLAGQSTKFHLASVVGLLLAIMACLQFRARRPLLPEFGWRLSLPEWLLFGSVVLVATFLLFITIFVPLTQNDALEYATVGRILFEQRSIGVYPVLDAAANKEGFYGPWTHPPLYVALMYIAEVAQGHADAPGALRLVAPWFAIVGTALAYTIGRMVDRSTGLAAALILLSTPLAFLGAGSALLDALPIAGFVMLLAAVLYLDAGPVVRGGLIGGVLGMCLWTHSLAIIFIPLALSASGLLHGLHKWRPLMLEWVITLGFALLVGGAHYVRNVSLFGAPISDNPIVFALPKLAWADYFIINRGLDSVVATVQYGLFKGWFALEAFGLSFWGLAIGFLFWAFPGLWEKLRRGLWYGAGTLGTAQGQMFILFGVLAVYYAGVVLSLVLGIDLMVKNERYLLAIQGLVALGSAYGYVRLFSGVGAIVKQPKMSRAIPGLGQGLLAVALTLQAAIFVQYALSKNGMSPPTVGQEFAKTLSGVPEYQLIDYLRLQTPEDAVVLSLKPADMYYSDRRMVGYLDPRLVPFYEVESAAAGALLLDELGVSYVHVPNYGIPPFYNSVLMEMLRDPQLSDLVFSTSGGQIYALKTGSETAATTIDISPPEMPWSRESLFELGGRKRLSSVGSSASEPLNGNTSVAKAPLGLFQRSLLTIVRGDDLIATAGGTELAIDLDVTGAGLINLAVVEYTVKNTLPQAQPTQTTPLGSFELSESHPTRKYQRRIQLQPDTAFVSIVLQQQGESVLTINHASVSVFDKDEAP